MQHFVGSCIPPRMLQAVSTPELNSEMKNYTKVCFINVFNINFQFIEKDIQLRMSFSSS